MREIRFFVKSEIKLMTKFAAPFLMGCGFLVLIALLLRMGI